MTSDPNDDTPPKGGCTAKQLAEHVPNVMRRDGKYVEYGQPETPRRKQPKKRNR